MSIPGSATEEKGMEQISQQDLHTWKYKFVSYNSSLFGYCFECKGYGHRESKCKNRFMRHLDAHEHKMSNGRFMHRSAPKYRSKNVFIVQGDRNVVCYSRNKFWHRIHKCRRRSFQSYG